MRSSLLLLLLLIFSCSIGLSQHKDLVSVINSFESYKSNILVERIYAHIDRPAYLVGETLWFKLFITDTFSHAPLDVSKVCYVEILGERNEAVLQTIVSMDNGMGYGSFVLPATLKSGQYIFRAYTSWMKNFDPEFYFQERVSIINPFVALSSTVSDESSKYDVQFFPEGGNLVYGLPSKVAFRAVNHKGKGVDFSGVILDSHDDTVSVFSPVVFGLGNFAMTPVKPNKYRAVIHYKGGDPKIYDLPVPLEKGYTLQVKDTTQDKVIIRVFTSEHSEASVYLFAHSNFVIKTREEGIVQNGRCTFLLDRNQLGDGIVHLTVFNNRLSPVCERLYFNGITDILNINARVDKSEYKPREKVSLSISTGNNHGKLLSGRLSVSVYRIDSLVEASHQDITTYLKITSNLTGNIENPDFYFREDNFNKYRPEIDNLMLTHGWRRFQWDSIQSKDRTKGFLYIPELRGHLLRGFLLNRESKAPMANVQVYFSAPHIQQFGVSKTNEKGEFLFETGFYGRKRITIQTDQPGNIELTSPFSTLYGNKIKFSELEFVGFDEINLNSRSIYSQVHNAFKKGADLKEVREQALLPVFGEPEREYLLDDYTRFPTLEEVLREYVPEIAVRKNKGHYKQVVIDPKTNVGFDGSPLILLDGTRILDVSKLMAIDPLKVKTLQVVNKKYFYAGLSFDGLINYLTYDSDLGGYTITDGLSMEYELFNIPREFFSPVYNDESERTSPIPDTRTSLYWNPNVTVDQNGVGELSFYTSDIVGSYRVVIQGITEGGLMGSSSFTINTKER